jgi:hypothetical protein
VPKNGCRSESTVTLLPGSPKWIKMGHPEKVRAQPVWHLLAYQPTAIDPNKIASSEMPKIPKFDP